MTYNEHVGYVSGYDINLQATFKVKTSSGDPLEDVTIKAENAQLGLSGTVYLGNVIGPVSTEPFYFEQFQVGLTQYFSPDEPFKLEWSYSTEGSAYRDIGVSKHTVYVTLEEKSAELDKVYLSYLHWAISNDGATSEKEVVKKTWQNFAPLNLMAWDGKRKLYYYPAGGIPEGFAGSAEKCLLSPSGYGQCTNFAELFSESLEANGIENQLVDVMPKTNDDFLIIVKEWHLKESSSFEGEYEWKLELYEVGTGNVGRMTPPDGSPVNVGDEYGDFINEKGLPGQNMETPSEKAFPGHHMVWIPENSLPSEFSETPYFDPSYGVTYRNEADFEEKAVFGYGQEVKREDGKVDYKVRKARNLNNILFGHY